MKVIFLDIDGVLNTGRYLHSLSLQGIPEYDDYGVLFDPESVANLNRIVNAIPDALIVIESTWKMGGEEWLRELWAARDMPGMIEGLTPDIPKLGLETMDLSDLDAVARMEGVWKAAEIQAWLQANAPEGCSYVILDDLENFPPVFADRHLRIDGETGISSEDVATAIRLLELDYPPSFRLDGWMEDLIGCPSQCYYYFTDAEGTRWCLYLRWRHRDPWTADLFVCDEQWRFVRDHPQSRRNLLQTDGTPVRQFAEDEYPELERAVLDMARRLFPDHVFNDRQEHYEP